MVVKEAEIDNYRMVIGLLRKSLEEKAAVISKRRECFMCSFNKNKNNSKAEHSEPNHKLMDEQLDKM